jgi:Nuclease-related domain
MEGSVARRTLSLRYPAVCSLCSSELPRGTTAWWDKEAKQATCLVCGGGADLARDLAGTAGGSGRQKYDRLRKRREKEVKGVLGDKLGSVYLFFKDEPQSTRAWGTGSAGEERLARYFGKSLPDSAIVLHDRRIPGSRANIDHIVVAPSGVWVIDAKDYKGKVERRDVGPFWRSDVRVFVGGRDRTKLVRGMAGQVEATRGALAKDPLAADVAVTPAVCFVASEWGFFPKSFEVNGVLVTFPGDMAERISARGRLAPTAVERLANRIAVGLPPAVRAATPS